MPGTKIIVGVAVMVTWLYLVLARLAPVTDYVEMLKGIMAAAVLIHLMPPRDKP